jgi:1-phosphofructokinase family hexose kinase
MADHATLVLTVTPNPSLDLLFESECLVWDDANRMTDPRRRPGGQGVNVARAVLALGGSAAAVALLGGATGREIARALEAEGTPLRAVTAPGETRTFVAVRELGTGRSMLLNARGPARGPDDVARLEGEVAAALAAIRPRWLACCGSVPPGFPDDFYARLAGLARSHGAATVVDCDGEPLLRALAGGCDLVVPNRHEAERLLGRRMEGTAAAAAGVRDLARSAGRAAITLGSDGAVIARGDECWHARAPLITTGSAVGAGDAFLAGLLVALEQPGATLDGCLRDAVAAGAATLLSRGSDLIAAGAVQDLRAAIEPARA